MVATFRGEKRSTRSGIGSLYVGPAGLPPPRCCALGTNAPTHAAHGYPVARRNSRLAAAVLVLRRQHLTFDEVLWALLDSNQRPTGYEPAALTN